MQDSILLVAYLTADHAPLSPQSSGASTGSAGSDLHNLPEDPAMSGELRFPRRSFSMLPFPASQMP